MRMKVVKRWAVATRPVAVVTWWPPMLVIGVTSWGGAAARLRNVAAGELPFEGSTCRWRW